jgi:hypothetical protein
MPQLSLKVPVFRRWGKRFLPEENCDELAKALIGQTDPKNDLLTVLKGVVEDEKVPAALDA